MKCRMFSVLKFFSYTYCNAFNIFASIIFPYGIDIRHNDVLCIFIFEIHWYLFIYYKKYKHLS